MPGDRRTTASPHTDNRFPVQLRGCAVDPETRCAHWDEPIDVIALRFGCCETYYPCFECHEATTGHEAVPWPRSRFDEAAVFCGACGETITVEQYLAGGNSCTYCDASFNPGCRKHRERYFEL